MGTRGRGSAGEIEGKQGARIRGVVLRVDKVKRCGWVRDESDGLERYFSVLDLADGVRFEKIKKGMRAWYFGWDKPSPRARSLVVLTGIVVVQGSAEDEEEEGLGESILDKGDDAA